MFLQGKICVPARVGRQLFTKCLLSEFSVRSSVVMYVVFNPDYCRVRIINMHNGRVSVELGQGKSLICITVESVR